MNDFVLLYRMIFYQRARAASEAAEAEAIRVQLKNKLHYKEESDEDEDDASPRQSPQKIHPSTSGALKVHLNQPVVNSYVLLCTQKIFCLFSQKKFS